jgi:hypothetical protein
VSADAYATGVAFFLVIAGCCALTAAIVVRRLDYRSESARWVAGAVVFTAALLGAHMLPGVLGVLTRGTVVATAALGAAVAWLLVLQRPAAQIDGADGESAPAGGPRRTWLLAVLGAAAIAVCTAAYYRTQATESVTSDDMLNFHLPLVARWIQSGSFWPVVDLLPYDTTGNYPQNGDVLLLASVLPWRGDAFARLAVVPYVGLAGLSTYALGLELCADRARAALMASVVVSIPILLAAGVTSGLPDALMYGMFGAGLVFLVRTVRTLDVSDGVIAGLALGIALGTKWYAVPAVGTMLVLLAAMLLVEHRGFREAARWLGIVGAAVAVAGGFWLVRNVVESGSPFFPAGWLPIGARSDVGNPGPRTDFPLAHYLFDGGAWRHVILPDELKAFGLAGILLIAGSLGAAVLAAVAMRRGERHVRPVAWMLVTIGMLAVVYAITPNTASGFDGKPVLVFYSARYLVPAAIPAAAVLAWAVSRLGRSRPLAAAVLEVVALIAVGDGLRRAFDLPAKSLVAGALAVALLTAAGWAALRIVRAGGRARAAAAALTVLVVAAAGGYVLQDRFAGKRLRGEDAAVDYFLAHSRNGDRVGLAEQWSVLPPSPVLAMFGRQLSNHVDYVGEHADGVNKPHRDRSAFLADVRRGHYRWLMIGRGMRPPATTPAMSWTAAAGYVSVAQTARLALYVNARGR